MSKKRGFTPLGTIGRHRKNTLSLTGFTLIEIIIAMGIAGIIGTLVLYITTTGGVSWSMISTQVFLKSQARQAISNVSAELVQSNFTKAFITDGGSGIRFNIPLVDPATGEVRLSPGGDILWGDGETEGNYINYRLRNGNLVRQILNASLVPIAGRERIISQFVSAFGAQLLASQFEFTLTLSVDRYAGRRFSPPINYAISFAVAPEN